MMVKNQGRGGDIVEELDHKLLHVLDKQDFRKLNAL